MWVEIRDQQYQFIDTCTSSLAWSTSVPVMQQYYLDPWNFTLYQPSVSLWCLLEWNRSAGTARSVGTRIGTTQSLPQVVESVFAGFAGWQKKFPVFSEKQVFILYVIYLHSFWMEKNDTLVSIEESIISTDLVPQITSGDRTHDLRFSKWIDWLVSYMPYTAWGKPACHIYWIGWALNNLDELKDDGDTGLLFIYGKIES